MMDIHDKNLSGVRSWQARNIHKSGDLRPVDTSKHLLKPTSSKGNILLGTTQHLRKDLFTIFMLKTFYDHLVTKLPLIYSMRAADTM